MRPDAQYSGLWPIFPLWWLVLFGVAVSLFVVQPWSLSVKGIPVQVMIVWMLFAWTSIFRLAVIRRAASVYTSFQWIMILLMILVVIGRIVTGNLPSLRIYQLLTGILLSLLAATVVGLDSRRRYVFLFLGTAAGASGLIAVLQALGFAQWSWKGTMYYQYFNKTPSGLETFPVAYSYSVLGIALVGISSAVYELRNREALHLIQAIVGLLSGILATIGLVAVNSRSGVLGIVVSVFLVVVGLKYLRKKFVSIPIIMLLAVIALSMSPFVQLGILDKFEHKTAQSSEDMRLTATWRLFLPVILRHPLGIPQSVHEQADTSVGYGVSEEQQFQDVLRQTHGQDPHNWVLTTGLILGIPGMIALLGFVISMLWRASRAIKTFRMSGDSRAAVLTLLFLSANVALLVHAWFHNASILLGEMRGWLWVGALMGLIALENERKGRQSAGYGNNNLKKALIRRSHVEGSESEMKRPRSGD